MALFSIDARRITTLASQNMGVGTPAAKDLSTSPRGILEWIVNFFSLGKLGQTRNAQAKSFTEAVAAAFNNALIETNHFATTPHRLPEDIAFHYQGYDITFTLPTEDSTSGKVRVYVRKEGECVSETLDKDNFNAISNCLLIRLRNRLPLTSAPLTEQGRMNLQGLNLEQADLKGFTLTSADLSGTRLVGADLQYVDLRDANLAYATLTNANLRQAQLQGACLHQAELTGTTLQAADMRYVDLSRALLTKTDIRDTNLTGANLSELQTAEPLLDLPRSTEPDTLAHHLGEWRAKTHWITTDYGAVNRAIASIDDHYEPLKRCLLNEVITSLQNIDTLTSQG